MPYTLEYRDRYRRTLDTRIESDTEGSVAFASIPDNTPTLLLTEWTGKQYTKLLSALMVGADLMFPTEADEIIWQLIKVVHQPIPFELPEDESGCIEYPPSAGFISYSPDSPFVSGDKADGWNKEAWFRWNEFDSLFPDWIDNWLGGIIEAITGYQTGDILFNIESIPINPIEAFFGEGGLLPKIEIRFAGTGIVEIELLSFPLGGKAIIELDNEPNALDILTGGILDPAAFLIELERDIINFPPDEYPVINVEIPVETAGDHVLYIVYIPILDDELIPIAFGGGFRGVELCGFEDEAVVMGLEDVRFNTENCTYEKRVLGEWTAIEGGDEWLMCVEALMATQAEIKQAIIDAAEQLAAQMLAGETENMVNSFEISKDTGEKTFIQSGLVDDPETSFDEFAGSKYGAVSEIAAKLELLLDMIDSYYGVTNGSPATLEGTTQVNIKTYFPTIPALMDAAITDYYAYRATQNRLLWDRGTVFPQYLYCNGYSINALGRWLVDISGFSVTKQQIVFNLWDALADTFFSDYYAVGQEKPTNGYLDAACVPIPDQTLEAMTFGNARVTTPFKASHRMKFRITGFALDVDGDTQDAFWFRTAAGVLTRTNWTFTHSAGNNQPSDNQVPYNDAHIYEYTVDLGALNAVMTITANKNAGMNATGLTYPTPFAVEISDLGLAVSQ